MLLLADVHLHPYAGSAILPDGRNKRLDDIMVCLNAALQTCSTGQAIVIAGDLFHDRKGVKPEALHRIGEWLNEARSTKVPVYILAGNHDLSIGGDGCASVMALRHATIITEPGKVIEIEGFKVGFIPYVEDPEAVRLQAKALRKDGAKILVAHLGIGDPRFADCIPVDYEVPGRISVDDLRPGDFEQVFLGHYHNPQELAKNVRYIGSPLQLSFKEAGQEKGWVRLGATGKPTRVQNVWSPKFQKMGAAEAVAKLAHKEIAETDYLWVTGCTKDDAASLKELVDQTGQEIRIESEQPVHTKIRIDATATQDEMLVQYVRNVAPEMSKDEARALLAAGNELLIQASQEGA